MHVKSSFTSANVFLPYILDIKTAAVISCAFSCLLHRLKCFQKRNWQVPWEKSSVLTTIDVSYHIIGGVILRCLGQLGGSRTVGRHGRESGLVKPRLEIEIWRKSKHGGASDAPGAASFNLSVFLCGSFGDQPSSPWDKKNPNIHLKGQYEISYCLFGT